MNGERWPDERTAALIALRREGFTRRQIAEQLGVTRNAVIGKLFRLSIAKPRLAPPAVAP